MIRMQAEDRRRHLYTIGQTGTGKSTFMKNLIEQDILNGEGVAVIDPHGELVDDILALIPKSRANDVIVFNPGDVSRPLGLNMLEIDPGQPQQKSFVIDDFFKILKMIYKDLPEAFGPIFEKFFKNTLMLLLDDYDHEIPTIAEISRVFADKEYRDDKLNRNTNPEIIRFWRYEAEKMSGEWSLPNMSGYITSKFAPFILNEYVRPIISQPKSAFNFRDVMDNRKILLVNLSKGLIGDLNANLLGMVIVSKLLVAALSRVDIENQEDRADFYLYIDEFQNFTTDSIATILSEARKYRLNLIMAHQFIKQLQENIRDAVFGNVGSMAVLRVGADDAEFLKNKFEPVFTPQDLMNIDNFNAYVNLLISNRTTRPFNVQFLRPKAGSPEIARAIKELSRLKYGRDRDEVEREFRQRQEASNFS
jgi:type IV secretory pathway TraG/TraD family ATPase VirD4